MPLKILKSVRRILKAISQAKHTIDLLIGSGRRRELMFQPKENSHVSQPWGVGLIQTWWKRSIEIIIGASSVELHVNGRT